MEPKPGSPTAGMPLPPSCSPPRTRSSNTRHDAAELQIHVHRRDKERIVLLSNTTVTKMILFHLSAFYFLKLPFVFRVCRVSAPSWSPCHIQGSLWGRRKINWASEPRPLLTSSWRTAGSRWATCWALVVPDSRSPWYFKTVHSL